MLLGLDLGFGNGLALGNILQLLVRVRGITVDGAVVHGIDDGGGGGDGRKNVVFLHALPDGARDVLGEQHRGIHGGKELLHGRGASPLGPDAEALELPLEGVGALQGGAPVVLAGIQRFQHLGKAHTRLTIHTLFQFQIVITHFSFPPVIK